MAALILSPNGGPCGKLPLGCGHWCILPGFTRSWLGGLMLSGPGELPSALIVPASVLGQLTLWVSLLFRHTVTATFTSTTVHMSLSHTARMAFDAWPTRPY